MEIQTEVPMLLMVDVILPAGRGFLSLGFFPLNDCECQVR